MTGRPPSADVSSIVGQAMLQAESSIRATIDRTLRALATAEQP